MPEPKVPVINDKAYPMMKKRSSTIRLTVGAMAAALGVLLMYAAYLSPSGKLMLLFLASIAIWIPLNSRSGLPHAIVCYIATALLSFFLIPNKLYPLSYALCFGTYAFIKRGIDSAVKSKFIAFAIKLFLMNTLAGAFILLAELITKQDVFRLFSKYPMHAVAFIVEIGFVIYEIAFTFAIDMIDSRLRRFITPR